MNICQPVTGKSALKPIPQSVSRESDQVSYGRLLLEEELPRKSAKDAKPERTE